MKGFRFNLTFANRLGNMSFGKVKMRDFAKERYLQMAKVFPQVKQEHVEIYGMLIMTFIAMSFLGLFAISPTLTTIVELNKKLDDSKYVFQQLETKKANLSSLHSQYDQLSRAWPIVNAAVPDAPNAAYLAGQIHELADQQDLKLTGLQTFPVELTKKGNLPTTQSSFVIVVSVEGTTEKLQEFLRSLTQFDRIVRIESITYSNDEKTVLTVRIRTFFTP